AIRCSASSTLVLPLPFGPTSRLSLGPGCNSPRSKQRNPENSSLVTCICLLSRVVPRFWVAGAVGRQRPKYSCPPAPACGRRLLLYFALGPLPSHRCLGARRLEGRSAPHPPLRGTFSPPAGRREGGGGSPATYQARAGALFGELKEEGSVVRRIPGDIRRKGCRA